MRKTQAIVLALILGAGLDRLADGLLHSVSAAQRPSGGVTDCPSQNGDVNADGTLDLSDAVNILGYLYLGDPKHLVATCEVSSPGGLPATGLTGCYDLQGNETACDSPDCPGQDFAIGEGCPIEGRFVDNQDGTVTDSCTGLMWQKGTADLDQDGDLTDADRVHWCEALKQCAAMTLGGHTDWRLPNVRELQSLIDYGRFHPSIDPAFDAVPSWYWTSTSYSFSPDGAWYCDFDGGNVDGDVKNDHGFFRAVRGGR